LGGTFYEPASQYAGLKAIDFECTSFCLSSAAGLVVGTFNKDALLTHVGVGILVGVRVLGWSDNRCAFGVG
jgi:hypothetical protein